MDISAHIRELLFGHDCVIIPGFGGFIANYTPAQIDKHSGLFSPPVRQISFNRNLNHNDGLLIGKISGSAEIGYGDARSIVEDFAGDIRRKLAKGDKVILDHIGSFVNNTEGNIQFEPDRSSNYLLDSYGLDTFQFLPFEGYDVRKRILKPIAKDRIQKRSLVKVLWRAAVIIPLLSAIIVVSLKSDLLKTKAEVSNMNPLVAAELELNRKAIDESTDISALNSSAVVSTAPVLNSTENPVLNNIKTESYLLVTGSFKSHDNAVKQFNLLKAEGFDPEIIDAGNGFFRVSAITCSDIGTAMSHKESISGKFPLTWISKVK